jgi:uncharacterized protein (TIGR03437 family)
VTSGAILAVDRVKTIEVETSPGLAPPAEAIMIRNEGSGPMRWTAAGDAPWLRVAPASGEGAGATVVTFDAEDLAPGTYRGNVEIRSGAAANIIQAPVELRVLERGRPALKVGGAVDAANYCGRPHCYLAPGSLMTLFGSQLAYGSVAATTVPLPRQLGATRVLVNGTAAELIYVSYRQINFRLPPSPPAGGRWYITVERDKLLSNLVSAPYTNSAPAVFTANQSGLGYGAILAAGTSRLADAANPAPRNSFVEIYTTGLGTALAKPTVLFFGAGVTGNLEVEADYAGPAPGFPGLDQINVRVPAALPAGDRMRLQIRTPANLLSNPVEIAVR